MIRSSLILPLAALVLIIFLGYNRIFCGGNFFIHEDWIAVSGHTSGNKDSNGWRPDKGLGLSYFYGDPGMWHPWGIFSFLERILVNREMAYVISVVALDIGLVVVLFLFMRRFFSNVDPWLIAFLAPVVVFCFDASAQHYARAMISLTAGIPLLLWLLYDYYHQPKWLHVLSFALLLWAVAFLGNLWSLTQMLSLGVFFTILYQIYFQPDPRKTLKQWFLLYGAGISMVLFLGAWVFYSFGLDQMVQGYVREKGIPFPGLQFIPQLKPLAVYLCGFIPFEGIPLDHNLAAFSFLPYRHSVSVIFVFTFLYFLGRRSQDFWEYALKWLLAIFFIHGVLSYGKLMPAYGAVYEFISNKTSKLIAMYIFIFSLETLLIALFVIKINAGNVITENKWCRRLQVVIAGLTVVCYTAVLVIACLAKFLPGSYQYLSDQWLVSFLPGTLGGYSKELLSYMLSYNAKRYQELVRPELLIFFMTSIVVAGIFLKDSWLRWAAGLPKITIAAVIMINALFLSWSIYPLNQRQLVWEKPQVKELAFEPTDRFYFVRNMKWEKTIEGFRKRWEVAKGHSPRQNKVGYLEPPGLNISGFKSFTSKAEGAFMRRIFTDEGFEYKRLYYGSAFVYSERLNMAGVKYYYSDGELENRPADLIPFAQDDQLYIYRNTAAWPYYFLADRLEGTKGQISSPKFKTAYVSREDVFELAPNAGRGKIELKEFRYGRMTFEFQSPREEVLVISDAWHPFWRAQRSTGEFLKIIKTNEVFKGVRLPAGNYQLQVYFDTRPYLPGVWVSVVAWLLWFAGWFWAYKNRREIVF